MAEVSFFILGALFTFALVAALLLLLGAGTAPPVATFAPKGGAGREDRQATDRAERFAPQARPSSHRPNRHAARIAGPICAQAGHQREAYRIAAALDEAERTLTRIARGPEGAAAKIAAQTLRRLTGAPEPPRARLAFAKGRLKLLSLRPDPMARLAARAALRAIT